MLPHEHTPKVFRVGRRPPVPFVEELVEVLVEFLLGVRIPDNAEVTGYLATQVRQSNLL